jgi:Erv1 / Alr family
MVSPEEWGPHGWELLHGITERVGRHGSNTLIRDEQNSLRLTLRHFWKLMPCSKCQNHYKAYLRQHPPELFLQSYGEFLRESLRGWLFALHEEVNAERSVSPGVKLEDLPERYANVNLRHESAQLRNVYQRGLQSGVLHVEDWKMAWRTLDTLLRFIGV